MLLNKEERMATSKELKPIKNSSNSLTQDEELLLQTVAKGSTPSEFKMFLEFAKATGLNPYKKEIWFIKDNQGRVQMMTGINGFLAIANRHPEYDGMQVSINEENGKLVSATARVYRKDRKIPSEATVYYCEYAKQSPIWRQMPRMMLTKVAKSVALREAFPQELNGIYTQEEMPQEYSLNVKEEKVVTYDVSKYHDKEKIPGILDWFKKRGDVVEGNIVKTTRPEPKMAGCEIGGEDEIK